MSHKITVSLPDLAATESMGRHLATIARQGDCILLNGPLGAGKTALARAFLRAAADDPTMEVPSPSFTLVQIYDTKIGPIFHYDLWRLDGPDSLEELDWQDALDAIVVVELPDRLGPLRPADALTITLSLADGEAREAILEGWPDRIPTQEASWPSPGLTGGSSGRASTQARPPIAALTQPANPGHATRPPPRHPTDTQ